MTKPIYISFNSPIDPTPAQALMATLADAVNNNHTEINILLSTPGGRVDQGLTLYNFIRSLPITINTFNIGNVNSIGNIIFQSGENKIACPSSSFMFHGVGFDITNQRFELSHLEEKKQSLQNDQQLLVNIIHERTGLPIDEVNNLFRSMAFINAEESVERGISNEVRQVKLTSGVPIHQLIF